MPGLARDAVTLQLGDGGEDVGFGAAQGGHGGGEVGEQCLRSR